MARPLSQFSQDVFDNTFCDELKRGGCGAKKGERCHSKRGVLLAYPHEARKQDYLRQEENKKKARRSDRAQMITQAVECDVRFGGCGAPVNNFCVSRSGSRVTGGFHAVREKLFNKEELDPLPVPSETFWPFGLPEQPPGTQPKIDAAPKGDKVTVTMGDYTLEGVLFGGKTVIIDGLTGLQDALANKALEKTKGDRVETVEGSLWILHNMEGVGWLIHRMAELLVDHDWDKIKTED
jgi:hypothetical protein